MIKARYIKRGKSAKERKMSAKKQAIELETQSETSNYSIISNNNKIYVHEDSVNCALNRKCVVCLHRLISKSKVISFTNQGITIPQNKRPETCPRFNPKHFSAQSYCGLYRSDTYLLTLGDGDFSYSLSLIRGGHDAKRLIATSYESFQTVTTVYQSCAETLSELARRGVFTLHGVDATNLQSCDQIESHSFDIVIWNFPCVGIEAGTLT